MKKIFLLVSIIYLLISCNSKVIVDAEDKLNIEIEPEKLNLKEYISEVEFIHLKEKEGYILGSAVKVDVVEHSIFIIDRPSKGQNAMAIYKFDMLGNPIDKFENVGTGPDEYIEIVDFDINQDLNEINLLCFPPKLITLDLDLKIKKENRMLEKGYTQVVSCDSSTYIYSYFSSCLDLLIGEDVKTVLELAPPYKGLIYSYNSGDFSFFKNGKNIYFQPYLQKDIYQYIDQGFNIVKEMYYGNEEESKNFYLETDIDNISGEDRLKYIMPKINYIFEDSNGLKIAYNWGIQRLLFSLNNDSTQGNYLNGSLYGKISPINRNGYLTATMNVEDYCFDEDYAKEFYKGIKFKNTLSKEVRYQSQNPIIILYKLQ